MNNAVVSAAGGGKTTKIVAEALGESIKRCALITYTQNNVAEIKGKIYQINRCIPAHVEVWSWYSFLLRELARPYQSSLIGSRIQGIQWTQGRSDRYAKQAEIKRFYFGDRGFIYSDKIAQFVLACNEASGGAVIRRLEERFDTIYVDEFQDLAGYDLDLIELILRSRAQVNLVGDHRQATFRTNNSARNSAYSGIKVIKKVREWEKLKLCNVTYQAETHRCNQGIADIADGFFPWEPKTKSRNGELTGHDGVFAVHSSDVEAYVERFRPQVLRLDVKTDCHGYESMNFGESKGLTFERVLIFPHKLAQTWLATGDIKYVEKSASKMYVGVSRARHSVAFVYEGALGVAGIARYLT
ncbi:DNA helicase-2/ATP-dependent DNA helicase PcrA [Bradyrhizobium japonicum USDA 38]|uniref:UvrD-helicase domain-containing protein n=1 Tax=Bradyrhizobium japonicum TaxID=375 RepID=UPI0007C4C933|nr:UvrD-helicase domain-containing protein [Bradyrhizobium japonicum]MCS3891106.1 DNA helicase-2/ATP-dependent DNA helicase PcrA [Bradyrhizobium japonicum USDA 38]MCS3943622.1 DNA helicase-2/ATP-dependent DNA helicase PcrA [Bradyrhizobium japonicum]